MKSPTHIVIGAYTYANYVMLTNAKFDILDIPIVLAFSVLPDIDTHTSKISSKLRSLPMKIIIYTIFLSSFLALCYLSLLKNMIPKYSLLFVPIMILLLKFFSKNKILKKISLSLFFICIYALFYRYSILGTSKNIFLLLAIIPFFEHRSFSHSVLAVAIIGTILLPIYKVSATRGYYIVILLSYSSHLFLGDIFTKKGLPLMYPFSRKYYSANIFKSKKIYNNLDIPFTILYGIITAFVFVKIYAHS